MLSRGIREKKIVSLLAIINAAFMESPENKLSHSLAVLLLSEERNYLTDYNPLLKSNHNGCIHEISYV